MILGIDPGLSGAIAQYGIGTGILAVTDIPTLSHKVNGKERRVLDLHALVWVFENLPVRPQMAIIEDVHSMPKQGVASSFTFGKVVGAIEGVLVALSIPMTRVAPHAWKRRLSCSHDKDDTRRRASELLPTSANWWPLKRHDGRAEAALLAYYGATYL